MRLRAHHLLCLLGFRGLGYSQEFVDNMAAIAEQVSSLPQTMVQIVSHPDDICSHCPFLGERGCQQEGPQAEEIARRRDRAVMERLNLIGAEKLPWSELRGRIRRSISPQCLAEICQGCQWLPQGYCLEGLERLKDREI